MRSLPLFPTPPRLPVESQQPRQHDPACSLCGLAALTPRNPCHRADGEPGGLYVLSSRQDAAGDALGRPLAGPETAWARREIQALWKGPIVWDSASRCPGRLEGAVEACRGYTRTSFLAARPARVLCLGPGAALSVLGTPINAAGAVYARVRGAHGWWREPGNPPVPVAVVADPSDVRDNRFLKAEFLEDLRWALTATLAPPAALAGTAFVVETPEDAGELAARVKRGISLDMEWAGRLYSPTFSPLCVAFAVDEDSDAFVVPLHSKPSERVLSCVRGLLADLGIRKTGSYVQNDLQGLRLALGVRVANVRWDAGLMLKQHDPECASGLAEASWLVGLGGYKGEIKACKQAAFDKFRARFSANEKSRLQAALFADDGWGRLFPLLPVPLREELCSVLRAQRDGTDLPPGVDGDLEAYKFALVQPDDLYRYNAVDAVATALLAGIARERLGPAKLLGTWDGLVAPGIPAFARLEENGVGFSAKAFALLQQFLRGEQARIRDQFRPYGWDPDPARSTFNPDSAEQLEALLFDKLGLEPPRETGGGRRSTDKDALRDLEGKHPIVRAIQEDRRITTQLEKGFSRFVRADGRIHTRFKIDGARTGRLSSADPALQNIMKADTPEGKLVRSCFVAADGNLLVEADYSQQELRIGAGLAGEKLMIEVFARGEDIHLANARRMAPLLWKHPDGRPFAPDDVGDKERTESKAPGFAVFYDDGEYGLAYRLRVPVEEARKIRDAMYGAYKRLPAFISEQVAKGRRDGCAWTWWDGEAVRRRPLRDLGLQDERSDRFKTARRSTWNAPIQGTANEFCYQSIVRLCDWIEEDAFPGKLCLTVHDSILAEVREDCVEEYAWQARRIMTSWRTPGGVPLAADFKVGKTWGSMKKWEPAATDGRTR